MLKIMTRAYTVLVSLIRKFQDTCSRVKKGSFSSTFCIMVGTNGVFYAETTQQGFFSRD